MLLSVANSLVAILLGRSNANRLVGITRSGLSLPEQFRTGYLIDNSRWRKTVVLSVHRLTCI